MRQVVPVGLIVLLSFLFGPGAAALAQPTPPIIDLHFHADLGWDKAALVRLFDQLGVARAGGGPAGPDTLGLSFASTHPDRFIPFGGQGSLVRLMWREGTAIWNLQSSSITDYLRLLETLLRLGQLKGIGEIFVNNVHTHPPDFTPIRFPADSPLMRRLWAFSAMYGVPVHVHAEADGPTVAEMERLLESNREGTWLWAHTGFFIEPPLLRRLFQHHPNLFCELSWRDERPFHNIPISQGGQLRSEWKELLEEFPDRFVIGTDIGGRPSLDGYSGLIGYWRGILKQLSPEAAEKLAHENAERILKLPPLRK